MIRLVRILKLFALLLCQSFIITLVLGTLALVSLRSTEFSTKNILYTDFVHNISTLLDQNSTLNGIGGVQVTDNSIQLVELKLETLGSIIPQLIRWYDEGHQTNPPESLDTMEPNQVCGLFKTEATLKRHILLNVFNDNYPAQNNSDLTLATQGTINRLLPLVMTAKNWPGPIQVAFHLSKEDIQNLTNVFAEEDVKNFILKRSNIVINFIIKIGNFYPINFLRNVVLNNTRTPWIFLTDMDFVPSPGVYPDALEMLTNQSAEKYKKVHVVAAFSSLVDNIEPFPTNKTQLMQVWNKKIVIQTQLGGAGQKTTNYKTWPSAKIPYHVKWKTDYEPYVIGPTKGLPRYDEFFLQRILDKCSQLMETSALGFEFWVMPNVFVIHIKHERPPGQEYHAGCAHKYYHKQFKIRIRKKYQQFIKPRFSRRTKSRR